MNNFFSKLTQEQIDYGVKNIQCQNCLTWHKIQCINTLIEPYFCNRKCEEEYKRKNNV